MKITYETSERIRTKKAQYCRFVDTKMWDEYEKLAFPDATFTFLGVDGEILYEFSSTKAHIETAAAALEGAQTSHRVSNSELVRLSDNQIAAIWAMEDYLIFRPRGDDSVSSMRGYGHYHETWELHEGDWFLRKLELRRTILEFENDHNLRRGS